MALKSDVLPLLGLPTSATEIVRLVRATISSTDAQGRSPAASPPASRSASASVLRQVSPLRRCSSARNSLASASETTTTMSASLRRSEMS